MPPVPIGPDKEPCIASPSQASFGDQSRPASTSSWCQHASFSECDELSRSQAAGQG
ncbi:hypothetical protein LTR40_011881, partial [Exophiala xenobiotica]